MNQSRYAKIYLGPQGLIRIHQNRSRFSYLDCTALRKSVTWLLKECQVFGIVGNGWISVFGGLSFQKKKKTVAQSPDRPGWLRNPKLLTCKIFPIPRVTLIPILNLHPPRCLVSLIYLTDHKHSVYLLLSILTNNLTNQSDAEATLQTGLQKIWESKWFWCGTFFKMCFWSIKRAVDHSWLLNLLLAAATLIIKQRIDITFSLCRGVWFEEEKNETNSSSLILWIHTTWDNMPAGFQY